MNKNTIEATNRSIKNSWGQVTIEFAISALTLITVTIGCGLIWFESFNRLVCEKENFNSTRAELVKIEQTRVENSKPLIRVTQLDVTGRLKCRRYLSEVRFLRLTGAH